MSLEQVDRARAQQLERAQTRLGQGISAKLRSVSVSSGAEPSCLSRIYPRRCTGCSVLSPARPPIANLFMSSMGAAHCCFPDERAYFAPGAAFPAVPY